MLGTRTFALVGCSKPGTATVGIIPLDLTSGFAKLLG
jgi:hypothetical protein